MDLAALVCDNYRVSFVPRRAAGWVARGAVVAWRATSNLAKDLALGHVPAAKPTRGGGHSSDHRLLRSAFAGRVRETDVLVDLGCGRGRVLAHWLRAFPNHRVVGIEWDPSLAARTSSAFRGEPRCAVIAGDAVKVLPPDATLLYLFDLLGKEDMAQLRSELEVRPLSDPPQRIVYCNPRHVNVFESSGGWRVERINVGGGDIVPLPDVVVIDRVV